MLSLLNLKWGNPSKWGTQNYKFYNICIIINLNIFMQCYYGIDWMILKSRMHYEFSLCKYMTLKLKWYIIFCHDLSMHIYAKFISLLIHPHFMIFAHTLQHNYLFQIIMLSVKWINIVVMQNHLLHRCNWSILFQKGYICIAINILLKVVLSIVRFSPYSLNTVFNDQFYFYLPKDNWINTCLNSFLWSCGKCFKNTLITLLINILNAKRLNKLREEKKHRRRLWFR
jgi:hypothetical protein